MLVIRRLIWDSWNVAHIARHKVTRDEVEGVCHGNYVVGEAYKGRIMLIGTTQADRMLGVILENERDDIYYVVTARSADRKERSIYKGEQGGEQTA